MPVVPGVWLMSDLSNAWASLCLGPDQWQKHFFKSL